MPIINMNPKYEFVKKTEKNISVSFSFSMHFVFQEM